MTTVYLEAYYYYFNNTFLHNVYYNKKTDEVYMINKDTQRILLDVNGCRCATPISQDVLQLLGKMSDIIKKEGIYCKKARTLHNPRI